MEKRYITVCQKGIIDKNLNVLPFGYNKWYNLKAKFGVYVYIHDIIF
jgi:hypothetical protein